MERKYKQRGYMDRGGTEDKRESREQERPRKVLGGPRTVLMPGTREVSRCAQCGVLIQNLAEPAGQCSKCGAALHSCKQCKYFDPGSRFECRQPVAERVARKDAANSCTFFAMKVTVEKETTSGGVRADDARRAFENLFKK
ncbi:MAG TPA: hypothetical protein VJN48_10125 [Terriglobales bacterium]|nr:hypothetical protein [Terriglobales bacterium]